MNEYLCENCTVAYCFDDCSSPLTKPYVIEVEEVVDRIKVCRDPKQREQENLGTKNPHKQNW
ncbi:conserved hypothetical protein [Vibrio chagasii]|nr:conserved hypothetical protein [Vibrio chagasii]CAH7009106.1 conserved hypothetical protein [Vibrio chagasii]CAH7054472.1 conserved hypothetical protein [Vibrio chagasii]CAH7468637.1 conserved hypothetical protein [Vibrio chagasii]CAH7472501.1 conserved hypothetical protein [Vibrio chagasii]